MENTIFLIAQYVLQNILLIWFPKVYECIYTIFIHKKKKTSKFSIRNFHLSLLWSVNVLKYLHASYNQTQFNTKTIHHHYHHYNPTPFTRFPFSLQTSSLSFLGIYKHFILVEMYIKHLSLISVCRSVCLQLLTIPVCENLAFES